MQLGADSPAAAAASLAEPEQMGFRTPISSESELEPVAAAAAAALRETVSELGPAGVRDSSDMSDVSSQQAESEPPLGIPADAKVENITMTIYVHDGIRFTKGTNGKAIRVDDRCQPTRARGCQGSGSKRRATAKCAKRQAKASGRSPPIGGSPSAWQPMPPNAPATGGASSSSQGATPPNAPATGGDSSDPALPEAPASGGTPAPPSGSRAPATGDSAP